MLVPVLEANASLLWYSVKRQILTRKYGVSPMVNKDYYC